VQNDPSLTLADLIRLDWAIAEQGKLVKKTKRSIADLNAAGVDSFEQLQALAALEQALSSLTKSAKQSAKACSKRIRYRIPPRWSRTTT
jgi:hypothetical protein